MPRTSVKTARSASAGKPAAGRPKAGATQRTAERAADRAADRATDRPTVRAAEGITELPIEPADKPQRGIQSLDVTGDLLAALIAAGTPLTLRDLAAAAGMAPAKAFAHLVSLQKIGLLARDAAGRYEAGPLGLELGLLGLARLSPVREADAELIGLAASTGMSVALVVPGPLGPTVVRLEESALPLHVSLRPGTVMSLVNTALGRVLAAWLDDDVLDTLLAQDSLRLAGTGQGKDEGAKGGDGGEAAGRSGRRGRREGADRGNDGAPFLWRKRLATIRAEGIDTAIDKPVPGISTVAAPVFDHTGSVCLVVAIMGPTGSLDTTREGAPAQLLVSAAQRLSRRFGYMAGVAVQA